MAVKKHVALLKRGVERWNKWREKNPDIWPELGNEYFFYSYNFSGANLSNASLSYSYLLDANLSGANLSGSNLTEVKLIRSELIGADLRRADLLNADLIEANLIEANLSGAKLMGADFRRADLSGANLCDADLRLATLIDSRLDGANLTGAKLWETQRSGWSIKGVTCRLAFWDRDGQEPTEYKNGDFERIFAEKPRIVLCYPGGVSPVDLAILPLIVEHLQAEHPDCALHIQSVQDDGSGATVTITVEDLKSRSAEAFAQDIEVLRSDLVTIQQRLQQEERLRLQAEASYRAMIQDVLPILLEKALSKTEINMSRDTYNIHGQTGAVGPKAHAHDMTFQQVWNQSNIDLPRLAEELARLRTAMKQETQGQGTREQDKAIVAVADAEEAAAKGDGPTALQHLKAAGQWALGIAERIGVAVAVEAIKKAM